MVQFYGISTIVGYLMPNPLYRYVLNIYDLVWLGFMAYQPLQVILLLNRLYTYIKHMIPKHILNEPKQFYFKQFNLA